LNVLTLNAGSNSLKFEIVAVAPGSDAFGESKLAGSIDDIGKDRAQFSLRGTIQDQVDVKPAAADHGQAARWLLDWLAGGGAGAAGISDLSGLDRVAHRVVHGADQMTGPTRISCEVLAYIGSLKELAPMHTESVLQVIAAAQQKLASIPMIAIFDTAFHRTIPDEAALYPLPLELSRRHRIRRYGFHGISHEYLATRYAQISGRPLSQLNLITLHLEGGSSATAIRSGKSADTSMGLTPLEGLMMGSRSGDMDPALVLYLMRHESWSIEEAERYLNKDCGLLGVSGLSADSRKLCEHLDQPSALLALQMYCYRVRKYIGAYLAALGGADAIIFGGGIGEDTPWVRNEVCRGLSCVGAVLDEVHNEKVVTRESRISRAGSSIEIWVIPTQEGLMMANSAALA
jgi:acetate kinase